MSKLKIKDLKPTKRDLKYAGIAAGAAAVGGYVLSKATAKTDAEGCTEADQFEAGAADLEADANADDSNAFVPVGSQKDDDTVKA